MGLSFRDFIEMFYNEPKNKFSLKTNMSQAKFAHAVNPANLAKPPSFLNPQAGMNAYNPRRTGPASIARVGRPYYPKAPSKGFKPAI